jgi:hypothetical protein
MPARLRDRCRVGAPIVNTQTDDRFPNGTLRRSAAAVVPGCSCGAREIARATMSKRRSSIRGRHEGIVTSRRRGEHLLTSRERGSLTASLFLSLARPVWE